MSNFDPSALPNLAYVQWQGQDAWIYSHYPEVERREGRDCQIQLEEDGPTFDVGYSDLLPPLSAALAPASVPVQTFDDRMKVVCISNNAGGVAKTSLTLALAGVYANEYSKRVLVIDLCEQANASSWSGIFDAPEEQTVHLAIVSSSLPLPTPQKINGYDIIPANTRLNETEDMARRVNDVLRLRERLEQLRGRYDIVLIDTSPASGRLRDMAAAASDYLLIPCTTAFKGVDALFGATEFRDKAQAENPALDVALYVPTMFTPRNKADQRALEALQAVGPEKLASPIIDRKALWEAATEAGKPISLAKPNSPAADEARRLAAELAAAIGMPLERAE